MLKPFAPFFPGSYHTEAALADLTGALTKHASVAAAVGKKVAAETDWAYLGVDPTPAPSGEASNIGKRASRSSYVDLRARGAHYG
jgi:hypothetical protein